MPTRVEVAVVKVEQAIEALSGPMDAETARHGWTIENRETALGVLEHWRNDLQMDGVVHPDHGFGWIRWLSEEGLPGSLTTDEPDHWVELVRDLDLYVSRMYS